MKFQLPRNRPASEDQIASITGAIAELTPALTAEYHAPKGSIAHTEIVLHSNWYQLGDKSISLARLNYDMDPAKAAAVGRFAMSVFGQPVAVPALPYMEKPTDDLYIRRGSGSFDKAIVDAGRATVDMEGKTKVMTPWDSFATSVNAIAADGATPAGVLAKLHYLTFNTAGSDHRGSPLLSGKARKIIRVLDTLKDADPLDAHPFALEPQINESEAWNQILLRLETPIGTNQDQPRKKLPEAARAEAIDQMLKRL